MKKYILPFFIFAATVCTNAFAADTPALKTFSFDQGGLSMLMPSQTPSAVTNAVDSAELLKHYKASNPALTKIELYLFSNATQAKDIEITYMYSKADADVFDDSMPAPIGKHDKTEEKTISGKKCRRITVSEKQDKTDIFICRTKKEEWSLNFKYKDAAPAAANKKGAITTSPTAKLVDQMISSVKIK